MIPRKCLRKTLFKAQCMGRVPTGNPPPKVLPSLKCDVLKINLQYYSLYLLISFRETKIKNGNRVTETLPLKPLHLQ